MPRDGRGPRQGRPISASSDVDTPAASPAIPLITGVLRQEVQHGRYETRAYVSPLMHPDDLERYNAIIPNGAERFLKLLEEEQAERHRMELLKVEMEESRTKRGQYLAALLLLICVAAAMIVVLTGHDYRVAIALVGSPIAAFLIAFVTGIVTGKSERVEKTRILASRPEDATSRK